MKNLQILLGICIAIPLTCTPAVASPTVLYQDHVVAVGKSLADPNDLWVQTSDLMRVNGFELKPEGACLDDICVPVKRSPDSDLLVTRSGTDWFNVTQLARKIKQPFAVDHDLNVWSFGAIPVIRSQFVNQHIAPEFTLLDRQGKPVSLSQYKDMKVLLLTWASW
jgi:hypothetical protein